MSSTESVASAIELAMKTGAECRGDERERLAFWVEGDAAVHGLRQQIEDQKLRIEEANAELCKPGREGRDALSQHLIDLTMKLEELIEKEGNLRKAMVDSTTDIPAHTFRIAGEEAKKRQHADEMHARLVAARARLARSVTQAELVKICDEYAEVVECVRMARKKVALIEKLKEAIAALEVKLDANKASVDAAGGYSWHGGYASAKFNTEEYALDAKKTALAKKIEEARAVVEGISKELEGRIGEKDNHPNLMSRAVNLKRHWVDFEVANGVTDGKIKVFKAEDGTEYLAVVPLAERWAGLNLHPKVDLKNIGAIVSSDARTTMGNYTRAQKEVCDSPAFVLHCLDALLPLCVNTGARVALEAMYAVYAGGQRVFRVLVRERSEEPILTQRYHTVFEPDAELVKATLERLYQNQGAEGALNCLSALVAHMEGAVDHMTNSGAVYYILPEVGETQDERAEAIPEVGETQDAIEAIPDSTSLRRVPFDDLLVLTRSLVATYEEHTAAKAAITERELRFLAILHILEGDYELRHKGRRNSGDRRSGSTAAEERNETLEKIAGFAFSYEDAGTISAALAELLGYSAEDAQKLALSEMCGLSAKHGPLFVSTSDYNEQIVKNKANVDTIIGAALKAKLCSIDRCHWGADDDDEARASARAKRTAEDEADSDAKRARAPDRAMCVLD